MWYETNTQSLDIHTFHGMEKFVLTFKRFAYGWLPWILPHPWDWNQRMVNVLVKNNYVSITKGIVALSATMNLVQQW
jgi:hypothetical protein